ncbi:group II intron reverse transcriptase [Clostridium sp. CF011]|uniref:group II intron reverse transcriptase n=2 Tax=Clostridium sp. CF011 TaxID=2843318 RepID=UPI00209B6DC9|nr:reverse transcriptase domain-containing protein [Clostridium sp. CF011]
MWYLGIRDKQLISVISKMLKGQIEGEEPPTKGTPQGGILSPLLSNIVLNELDWWVSSQWENMKTTSEYKSYKIREGKKVYDQTNKIVALKKIALKECYIVRYADDFKVFCRDYKSAQRVFIAVKQWLKERLGLDISPEKSKVTNLRKNYTEFLGIKLKATPKKNKCVCKSHMTNKAINETIKNFKDSITRIQQNSSIEQVNKFNSQILGKHIYYNMATHISEDFSKISFLVTKILYNRLHKLSKFEGVKGKTYMRYYGNYNLKTYFIRGRPIFPIAGIKTNPTMSFNQDTCNYTEQGRLKIHKNQKCVNAEILRYLMINPVRGQSVEYNDNRQSLYTAQKGCCGVTGKPLKIHSMECHHKIPKEKGGTDDYSNLILLNHHVHKLVHVVVENTINKYIVNLNLDEKALNKINSLRQKVGNSKVLLTK